MLIIHPYLSFNGNCEAAFNFYKSVFGGEFTGIFRFKDMPGEPFFPESEKEWVMHMSLPISEQVTLMGADASAAGGYAATFGNNITLSINPDNEKDTKRIFDALSQGGKITMPLEKTFWADLFGMMTDKFGVCWMISFGEGK